MSLLLFALPSVAAPPVVKVQIRHPRGAVIQSMPLEEYVAAVLAGESSIFRSGEALKAMAVAARTFAVRMRGRHGTEGFDFCDTTHCQALNPAPVPQRLRMAASATAGELLWYQGKPAFTPYTRDCGGRTEDASALWPEMAAPYLKSHPDSYCARAGSSVWRLQADSREIARALRVSGLPSPAVFGLHVIERTGSGRARTLALSSGGNTLRLSAGSFRLAVGRELGWNRLPSNRYEVHTSGNRLLFEGTGAGHGAGLCQAGAEQMGLEGRSYREILELYFPGATPGLSGTGLEWQRLAGERIALLTARPDSDRTVLGTAERLVRRLERRTGWDLPSGVELRVYPDVDSFRNATGEPGWVGAQVRGRVIHLQPGAVLQTRGALEATLGHELVHVLLEAQATVPLPVWFREGLAGWLAGGEAGPAAARTPADSDLAQTADAERARRAYAEAEAAVRGLVARYGAGAVLSWVKRGLPPEVTRARSSPAAVNSR